MFILYRTAYTMCHTCSSLIVYWMQLMWTTSRLLSSPEIVESVNSVHGWYAQCSLMSGVRVRKQCTWLIYVHWWAVYVVDMHSVHWWAVHARNRHGFESRRAIAAAHKLLPPAHQTPPSLWFILKPLKQILHLNKNLKNARGNIENNVKTAVFH